MGLPEVTLISPVDGYTSESKTPSLVAKYRDTEGDDLPTARYICSICGNIYDPALNGGVAFADLDPAWTCPGETAPGVACTGGKADYSLYEQTATLIIEIAKITDFNHLLQQGAFYNVASNTQESWAVPSDLGPGWYYWRVTATNGDGPTTSAAREIKIDPGAETRVLYQYINIAKNYDLIIFEDKRVLYNYMNLVKSPVLWTRQRTLYNYENINDDPPFPTIDRLNKYHAAAGDSFKIYGHGFGFKAAADTANADRHQRGYGGKVFIGALECGILSWGWNEITAQLPLQATSGLITVQLEEPTPTRVSNSEAFVVTAPQGTPGIGLEFKVALPANPMQTVAVLEGAFARQFVKQKSGTGFGSCQISEHDPKATPENLKDGNIIRCQLDGVDMFAWIIESYDGRPVDDSHQEITTLGGRGVLSILSRASVYPEGWPNHESLDRTWTDTTGAAILVQLILEAQARGTIPEVTLTFSATHDSNGLPWPDITNLKVHVGQDLLQVLEMLVVKGTFDIEMDAAFSLHAYIKQGIDRSGEVVFMPGKGLLAHGHVRRSRGIKNALLVEGENELITEVSDTTSQNEVGRREGFLMARSVTSQAMLSDYGNAALTNVKQGEHALQITVDERPYLPLFDYDLGDYISVKNAARAIDEKLRVAGITVQDKGPGLLGISLDLNTMLLEAIILHQQRLDRITNNSVDPVLTSESQEAKQKAGNYLNLDSIFSLGDLLVNTLDGWKRLALGSAGHMLVADPAEAMGMKWQATAAGPHASTHASGGSDSLAAYFAAVDHNHDLTYAALAHDHDLDYAALNHHHDASYAALTHGHAFTDLSDTPASLVAGKMLQVNAGGTALELVDPPAGGSGSSTFTGLSDTPASYAGQANKVAAVKSDESGLEFVTPSSDPLAYPLDIPPAIPSSWDDDFTALSLDAKWQWVNQGGASYTYNGDGQIKMNYPSGAANGRWLVQDAPAGDFTMRAKLIGTNAISRYATAGIIIGRASDGWALYAGYHCRTIGRPNIGQIRWNTFTATAGDYAEYFHWFPHWVQVAVSGTIAAISYSWDGQEYVHFANVNIPSNRDKIGFGGTPDGSAIAFYAAAEWFRVE